MNNDAYKYFALVLELPAIMLALYYLLSYFDGPQQSLGGYGGLIGLLVAIVVWVIHLTILAKKSEGA